MMTPKEVKHISHATEMLGPNDGGLSDSEIPESIGKFHFPAKSDGFLRDPFESNRYTLYESGPLNVYGHTVRDENPPHTRVAKEINDTLTAFETFDPGSVIRIFTKKMYSQVIDKARRNSPNGPLQHLFYLPWWEESTEIMAAIAAYEKIKIHILVTKHGTFWGLPDHLDSYILYEAWSKWTIKLNNAAFITSRHVYDAFIRKTDGSNEKILGNFIDIKDQYKEELILTAISMYNFSKILKRSRYEKLRAELSAKGDQDMLWYYNAWKVNYIKLACKAFEEIETSYEKVVDVDPYYKRTEKFVIQELPPTQDSGKPEKERRGINLLLEPTEISDEGDYKTIYDEANRPVD